MDCSDHHGNTLSTSPRREISMNGLMNWLIPIFSDLQQTVNFLHGIFCGNSRSSQFFSQHTRPTHSPAGLGEWWPDLDYLLFISKPLSSSSNCLWSWYSPVAAWSLPAAIGMRHGAKRPDSFADRSLSPLMMMTDSGWTGLSAILADTCYGRSVDCEKKKPL